MEFDHNKFGRVVEEDRLSSLPDELIHNILFRFDMKFVVQTCLVSSRWKLLWTSMPCLNFSSVQFGNLHKFAEFVTRVLSHRNHQTEVSLVKLNFHGAVNQRFVRKIANYAFSHNVQQLTIVNHPRIKLAHDPPFILSSQTQHFTFISHRYPASIRLRTPLNFPALTILHLFGMVLCGDLFTKCVNLKNLTLERFFVKDVEVLDINTPRLSNLILISGRCSTKVINVIAPQLENLTISSCSIKKVLVAQGGISSLCYNGHHPLELSKTRFHSLNKATICLSVYSPPYKEEDARKTINMFQALHCARYITLNADMVECISSFPDLLSHHPSPFSNLICLTIDCSMKDDAYKVKMSTEARNFFLENSPSATLVMKLPKGLLMILPT